MRWVLIIISILACAAPWRLGFAQDATGQMLLDALVARTPGTTLDRLRSRPDDFAREAAGLILGFGGKDGLSEADIEVAINVELARLRAREIRRLLEADLNDDLAVDQSELTSVLSSFSATKRGRLVMWHRTADQSGDGIVTWTELRQFAHAQARTALPQKSINAMRAMMAFDLDGNGRVALQEVLEAMTLLGAPA